MDVEIAGNSILSSLETEVEELSNSLSVEMFLLLLEKWERDIHQDRIVGVDILEKELIFYVKMKIGLHHLMKKYHRDGMWMGCDPKSSDLQIKIDNVIDKVKQARRNYYVAKRRAEGEHRDDCTCRGCKCLGQVGTNSQGSSSLSID